MIIYISCPTDGRREEVINADISLAQDQLHRLYPDAIMIDGRAAQRAAGVKHRDVWALSKAIEAMSSADAAYFCDGWKLSRGCAVEHLIALTYNIDVLSG